MKKIVIALFASIALVLGSGAMVSGASADEYPGTVQTLPVAPKAKTADAGKNVGLTVKVGAGNAKVSGKAQITIGGKKYTVKVVNGVAKFKFKAPKKGKKTYTIKYKPYSGSVYKPSTTKLTLTVK